MLLPLRSTRSVSCSSDEDDDEETEDDEEGGEEVEGNRRAASGSGSPLDDPPQPPQPQRRPQPPQQLEWGSLGLMYQGGGPGGAPLDGFSAAAAGPVLDAAGWLPGGGGASASARDDPLALLLPLIQSGGTGARTEAERPLAPMEELLGVGSVPHGGEEGADAAWGRDGSPLGGAAAAAAAAWRLESPSPLLPSWAFLDVSSAHLDTLKVSPICVGME